MKMWIEVFRTGVHTDSNGNTRQWTEEDLDRIVETYNNQKDETRHEAPVVIGHPVTDSPAYGWVEKLERRGQVLYAKIKDLAKEFVDWVKKGLYKKRSIALYDNLLVKHIGFLGAVPPAVKGLADPKFDENMHSFEFLFEEAENIEILKRSEKYGIKIKSELRKAKPEIYQHLSETDFADPVHYKFPLSKPYILASLATWSRPAARRYYSEDEARIILSRLLRAAKTHNIRLSPFKWAYSQYVDVPLENLTRQQFIELWKKNFQKTYEEIKMNEATFEQFTIDLLGWLAETFGEEVSAQTSAWIDENKSKYLMAPDSNSQQSSETAQSTLPVPQTNATPAVQANETPENSVVIELQKRIAQLEAENRLKDFKSYTEGLIHRGKLFPNQESLAISLLELGHKQGVTTYAENSQIKEIEGVALVKKLLESYPELALYQEVVKKNEAKGVNEFQDYEVDNSALELHTKVLNYLEESRKQGKDISYKEALYIITKGGK
ncbi:hypothetical protein D9V84_10365 [Bacteroidetes/Chlorobi group bacterium Naka2016]|jgi:hypothetical protein|nr:MAG: hypothetical protein D9V84_10365 [Bacteroidetes/Chlorobi group bacterium Naka2016]